MQQTLTLTANTHTTAKEIWAIISSDKAMMKIFNSKRSRQLLAKADDEDIAALKHELESKFSAAGITHYKIEITADGEAQSLKEEIIDIVKKGISEMGETTPLERLKIICELAPELTIAEAAPLIEGK